MTRVCLTCLVLLTLAASNAEGGEPCCNVTAIDARTGVVTAKVNATGRTFQFNAPPGIRTKLRVGQAIYADMAAGNVSVDNQEPCCSIVVGSLSAPVSASAAGIAGATANPAVATPASATAARAAATAPAPATAPRAAAATPAAATTGAPKFKAIWEPVPFNRDIDLNAIACVGPETCWVVGSKSTILFTTDGGKTWQVQLGGDPEATDDPLTKIFFLDAKNGWAMTDRGKILGTRDGSSWVELSTVSGTAKGVWFMSPQNGLEIENSDSTSQSTQRLSIDGGKTWKPMSRCSVDASVGGLPRKLGCVMRTMQLLSPAVGVAGGSASGETDLAAFGKTSDGGQTWTMSVIPETKWPITAVKFWTDNDGIVVLSGGEDVYWTADAGATWTRSVKQRLWPSFYGEAEGRIAVGVGEGGGIGYSFNGGRNFTSRPFTLPARVRAVMFPDAQHGYLVGQHAMVFRYRIVPIDYTSPGMIGAMAP